MQFTLAHSLGRDAAIQKLKAIVDHAAGKLPEGASLEEARWEGSVLHFVLVLQGQRITGTASVEDHAYDITVTLPFMMRLFEGKSKAVIEEQMRGALGG